MIRRFLRLVVDVTMFGLVAYSVFELTGQSLVKAICATAIVGLYGAFCFWDGIKS